MTEKRCTKCEQNLPATPEFFVRCSARGHKDGLFTICKVCRRDIVNAHNRKRRERTIASAGRTPGRCDTCGLAFAPGAGFRSAHWDHNHDTDEFRGWLCRGCNLALGCAGDNPRILDRLAAYLREHGHYTRRPVIR